MRSQDKNFYRIDDVLIRVGIVGLVVMLAVGGVGVFSVLGIAMDGTPSHSSGPMPSGKHLLVYLALLACPVVSLRIGLNIQQRERRIVVIWALLKQHAQISIPDLLANSDFSIDDVARAVTMLNTRGLGHYVWDRKAGTVQDGRLRSTHVHVEKCDACGGSISLSVPIGFTSIPACPYCGDPISTDVLEERRAEMLDALRPKPAPEKSTLEIFAVPFSIPIFGFLALVFWPAALAYAMWKYRSE